MICRNDGSSSSGRKPLPKIPHSKTNPNSNPGTIKKYSSLSSLSLSPIYFLTLSLSCSPIPPTSLKQARLTAANTSNPFRETSTPQRTYLSSTFSFFVFVSFVLIFEVVFFFDLCHLNVVFDCCFDKNITFLCLFLFLFDGVQEFNSQVFQL